MARTTGSARGRAGLVLLGAGIALASWTLGLAVWPTFLSPEQAPGVDAPGCSWGVVRDLHPDVASTPGHVRRCEEIIGARRHAVLTSAAGSVALAAAWLLVRRREVAAQRS